MGQLLVPHVAQCSETRIIVGFIEQADGFSKIVSAFLPRLFINPSRLPKKIDRCPQVQIVAMTNRSKGPHDQDMQSEKCCLSK